MNDAKLKAYGTVVQVKPKPNGIVRYKAKSFKGIALAENPAKAKELAINIVLDGFSQFDGSKDFPKVTRSELTVTECKLYGDFTTKQE